MLGLEEILGKGSFQWGTDIVPGKDYVELIIRFDPSILIGNRVVDAMVEAMKRYPDPSNSGPVEVIYEPKQPSEGN